jgi:uncharacterized membrane protein
MDFCDNLYWGVPLTSVTVIQFWLTEALHENSNVFFDNILVCLCSVDGSTMGFPFIKATAVHDSNKRITI